MKKIFFMTAVIAQIVFLSKASAQYTTISAGGNSSGNGGNISYSIGQVFCNTTVQGNYQISEGVQLSFDVPANTAVQEAETDINISIFPNPASDFISLKVKNETVKDLTYQLYNLQGKILQSEQLSSDETLINMSQYGSASYFLIITNQNQAIKTFKIIKE
jgi:hypothetical protein